MRPVAPHVAKSPPNIFTPESRHSTGLRQTGLLRIWAALSNNRPEMSANEASSSPRPSMRARLYQRRRLVLDPMQFEKRSDSGTRAVRSVTSNRDTEGRCDPARGRTRYSGDVCQQPKIVNIARSGSEGLHREDVMWRRCHHSQSWVVEHARVATAVCWPCPGGPGLRVGEPRLLRHLRRAGGRGLLGPGSAQPQPGLY